MNNENNEQIQEEEVVVNDSVTPTDNVQTNSNVVQQSQNTFENPVSFTQEQVNEIVTKRLNRVYERYGVKDSNSLDVLMGKSQAYEVLKNRVHKYREELKNLKEEMAFYKNDIDPTRYDDIRAYFKGKGIEFNDEAFINELANHPEWKRVVEQSSNKVTTISAISPDRNVGRSSTNEKDEIAKLFGFKNGFVR